MIKRSQDLIEEQALDSLIGEVIQDVILCGGACNTTLDISYYNRDKLKYIDASTSTPTKIPKKIWPLLEKNSHFIADILVFNCKYFKVYCETIRPADTDLINNGVIHEKTN